MRKYNKMATQILDTELDVCRKNLHFAQRDLYLWRFGELSPHADKFDISYCFKKVKYWRMRYNAAMAIQQAREEIACFRCVCFRCGGDHSWCRTVRDGEYY